MSVRKRLKRFASAVSGGSHLVGARSGGGRGRTRKEARLAWWMSPDVVIWIERTRGTDTSQAGLDNSEVEHKEGTGKTDTLQMLS